MPAVGAATFWMNGPAPVEPLRVRRVPLFLAALAFAAGLVCGRHWHEPSILTLSCLLLFGLACVALRCSPRIAWAAVLALWVGVGCWCAQLQVPIFRQTALTAFADGLSRNVRGQVVAVRTLRPAESNSAAPTIAAAPWLVEPGGWESETGSPGVSLDLAVDSVEQVSPDQSTMEPVPGGVRVTLLGPVAALRCGDELELPLRLRVPEIYRDPGAFSYSDWLLGQGIGTTASAQSRRLQVLQRSEGSLRCRLKAAQRWSARKLESLPASAAMRALPPAMRITNADAAMLAAMLFGDRSALTEDLRAGFERTGTFHLFVVSGLHIALFTGVLFWMFRRLRIPELPALALTLVLAFAYALLTGFGAPVQRAFAMSALYLIARVLDRQGSSFNALGAAALLILAADPRALYEPSFQMTALVILAVAGLGAPVAERLLGPWRAACQRLEIVELDLFLPPRVAGRRIALRMWGDLCRQLTRKRRAARLPALAVQGGVLVAESLILSLAIELCMALPMAVYFHRAVPLALPGNLFVAPLAVVLAGAGVLTFLAACVGPWLAVVPAAFTTVLLHLLRGVVDHLGRASLGDLRVPSPPPLALVLFCALLIVAALALRSARDAVAWAGAAAGALLLVVVLWPTRVDARPGTLEVTALDVGQGDSLLVISPEGRTLLVDAGGPVGQITTRWDVGEQVVAPYLWSRHIRRLDAVLISHAHSDHIGGMPAILRDLRPRELWYSVQPGESPALVDLLAQAHALGIVVHPLLAGNHFGWGGLQAQVLAPEPSYQNAGPAKNNDSLVLRLDWQKASVLLEGDAEAPSEAAMVADGRLTPVTLLKVGHHGSRTSTTPDFLAAVAPRMAVISVGQHNTFGHPRAEVLQRLEGAHIQTFRTDRAGAESFFLHADGTIQAQSAYN